MLQFSDQFDAPFTTGQVGFVFGYKSGADYWLRAVDLNGTANIYHVVNGASTQVATTSYPAPVPGTASNAQFAGGSRRRRMASFDQVTDRGSPGS